MRSALITGRFRHGSADTPTRLRVPCLSHPYLQEVSSAGWVIAAAVTLILGYLVPSLVRRRQAIADSRVEDRFSADLRVLTRGRPAIPADRSVLSSTASLHGSRPVEAGRTAPSVRPALPVRGEEPTVNRPTGMETRRVAHEARRVAATRAALVARKAEQAAAARRRLVLTLSLTVAAVITWLAVGLADFSVLLAVFPTVVLAGVLWLGVRTARAERDEWAQVPANLVAPRVATNIAGPTYSASQLRSHLTAAQAVSDKAEVDSDLAGLSWKTDHAPAEIDVREQEPAQQEGSWTPVPVPVPTYTLKPAAVRREAAPYVAPPAVMEDDVDGLNAANGPEEAIDLRAVLARRRAVGA